MRKILISVAAMCVALAVSSLAAAEWKYGEVTICAEDAGWPPFSFPPESDQSVFRGFNADLLKAVLGSHGIPYKVVVRPWKRCLVDGRSGDVHIVLDAARNSEREQTYLLTNPIYHLTPAFFFSKDNAPKYPQPVSANELSGLFVCGQKGYIYNNFGFKDERVSTISKDLQKVLDLTRMKRCDIGLARKEILLAELRNFEHAHQIAYQNLLDTKPEQFYWMLNRNYEFASVLKKLIDDEVRLLQQSGAADAMLQVYLLP